MSVAPRRGEGPPRAEDCARRVHCHLPATELEKVKELKSFSELLKVSKTVLCASKRVVKTPGGRYVYF